MLVFKTAYSVSQVNLVIKSFNSPVERGCIRSFTTSISARASPVDVSILVGNLGLALTMSPVIAVFISL